DLQGTAARQQGQQRDRRRHRLQPDRPGAREHELPRRGRGRLDLVSGRRGAVPAMAQALERIAVPALALLASALLFGLLLAAYAGVDPVEAFALMYQGAFGSWFSWQNTLTRAAPLILASLCTALPARLGLVIIGNEGALVLGGLAAAAAGVAM